MTELLNGVEAPSDAELISRVRGGDVAAYGELYSRHVEAARRLGRQLVRGHDADDLVSDAFAKTLNVLQAGGGPDVAFRAYLLTSLRRLHVDRIRASKRVQPSDDMTLYDDGLPFQDPAVASFENGAAAKAFASLPERWQVVLWHLEVERQKPADIAPLLGMSANSVSALAYRAREGLRQAFLTMHLADCSTEECRWVNQRLGAYVRKGLSRRDTTKVEQHLDDCRRCTAMYLELSEVNSDLAGIIAPLLLGAAAAGYLSSAGGAGLTGVSALVGRIRDAVSGQAGGGAGAGATGSAATTTGAATAGGAVTAGGVLTAGGVIAAGVAAVTTAALVFGGSANERITEADRPVGVVQTPTPGGSEAGGESGTEEDRAGADEEAGATSPEGTSQVVVAAGEPAGPDTATHDTPPAGSTDGSGGSQDTADGAAGTRPSDSTGASGGVPGPAPGPDGDTTVRPEPGDDPGEQTDGQEPDPVGGPHVDLPGPVAPVPVPTDPIENPPLDDTPVDPPPGPEQPPVEGGGTGGSGGGGETGGAEDEAAGPATGGGDQAGGGGQPAQEPTEPPAVVTTALTLVEPQIVAESLVFDLTVTDDGVLPDAVTVTLAPETGGIRFDPDGVTSTTKGSPAADRRALRVTIPLVIADPGADTLLSFTVSAGDAYLILDSSGAPLDEPVALTYQAPEAPETPQISVVAATPVPHGTFWDVHVAVADPDGVLPDMPEFKLRNADGTPVDERSLRIISVEAEDGGFVVRILVPDGQGSHVLALQAGEEGPVTGAFRVGREAPENDAPGGEAPEGNGGSTSPGGPKDDHTPADADRGDGQSGQGTRRDPEQPGHNDGGNEGGRAEGHVPDVPGMFRDRAAKAIDQLPAPRARGHVFGNDR